MSAPVRGPQPIYAGKGETDVVGYDLSMSSEEYGLFKLFAEVFDLINAFYEEKSGQELDVILRIEHEGVVRVVTPTQMKRAKELLGLRETTGDALVN